MLDFRTSYDFVLAQFAAESYLDNFESLTDSVLRNRLQNGSNHFRFIDQLDKDQLGPTRMTNVMVDDFFATWEIIDHLPNQTSGFSATLLKHKRSGEYTLSFRSTESKAASQGGDAERDGGSGADGEILLRGFAWAQLADMERYFSNLQQGRLHAGSAADGAAFAAALGGSTLNVTGYSLAGHLAQVFTLMHYAQIRHTYNFNGAGFGGILGQQSGGALANALRERVGVVVQALTDPASVLDRLTPLDFFHLGYDLLPGLFGDRAAVLADILERHAAFNGDSIYLDPLYEYALAALPLDSVPTGVVAIKEWFGTEQRTPDPKITALFGHAPLDDFEITAGAGRIFGDFTPIFIEDQPNIEVNIGEGAVLDNLLRSFGPTHSIALLADSLAVHDLFQRLDPDVTLATLTQVLAAGSPGTASSVFNRADGGSLESALNALGQLVATNWFDLPFSNAARTFAVLTARNTFFGGVDQLRQAITQAVALHGAFSVESLVDVSIGDLISKLPSSIAHRYALKNLNPFVLDLLSPTAASAFYTPHNLGRALEMENFSTSYVEHRSRLLDLKLELGLRPRGLFAKDFGGIPLLYRDVASGLTIALVEAGQARFRQIVFGSDASDGRLAGGSQADFLFGGGGIDVLLGEEGEDYLEGNGDDDTLIGGAGADVLRGGTGFDTYLADNLDTITDSDGHGQILVDGQALTGGFSVPGAVGVFESFDQRFRYRLVAERGLEVFLDDRPGALLIESYLVGSDHLGISLDEFNSHGDVVVTSDGADVLKIDQAGIRAEILAGGFEGGDTNLLVLERPARTIIGQGEADTIAVLDDLPDLVIYGDSAGESPELDGDDFIELDRERTAAEHVPLFSDHGARVFGEGGQDFVSGSQRDDFIDGGVGADFLQGNYGTDVIHGGVGNDWLEGNAGNDFLYGGGDNDRIHGGSGVDRLFGGAGNDALYGDAGGGAFYIRDGVRFWDGESIRPFPGFTSVIADVAAHEAGQDFLYGGHGNDSLFGGSLSDVVDGGSGNDLLQGEGGDDILAGGTGNDVIWGDKDPATFAEDTAVLDGFGLVRRRHQDGIDVGGNDQLAGGAGDDWLLGGRGDDSYLFGLGDGVDVISDAGGNDRIVLQSGISPADVSLELVGDDISVRLLDARHQLSGDRLLIRNGSLADNRIEFVQFSDGIIWSTNAFESRLPDSLALIDGVVLDGGIGNSIYRLPADLSDGFSLTLTDPGGLDQIRFDRSLIPNIPPEFGLRFITPQLESAQRVGNSLVLDVFMRSDIDRDDVRGQVTLNNYYLDSGWIEQILLPSGQLKPPVRPPSVSAARAYYVIPSDGFFHVELDEIFQDDPLDALRVMATIAGGAFLPSWLKFDATNSTIAGRAPGMPPQLLDLTLTATDRYGLTATADVTLNIGNINVAPEVVGDVDNQVARIGTAFTFSFPEGLFVDPNPGDLLTITLTVDGRSELPAWLRYDSARGVLSGTPRVPDLDSRVFNLTATDREQQSATVSFFVSVLPPEGAIVGSPFDDTLTGTARADALFANGGPDVVFAGAGDDLVSGGVGEDLLHGQEGDDQLFGGADRDFLFGGSGDDTLHGGAGHDVLRGEAGDDLLQGGLQGDILAAGPGTDELEGGDGGDIYWFAPGDGLNTVREAGGVGVDVIAFQDSLGGEFVGLDDLAVIRVADDLQIAYGAHGSDRIVIEDWYRDLDHQIERITGSLTGEALGLPRFTLTGAELEALAVPGIITGTVGRDNLLGGGAADTLVGLAGNDTLSGRAGADVLEGGDGNDVLKGGTGPDQLMGGAGRDYLGGQLGDDMLVGGPGADLLSDTRGNNEFIGGPGDDRIRGGGGHDVYRFGRGDGVDSVRDYRGRDRAIFGSDLAPNELWFSRTGMNLHIDLLDSADRLVIQDWFRGRNGRIEQFVAGGGQAILYEAQVQQLVEAMAVFDVGPGGPLEVPAAIRADLEPVLAAAWHVDG